jgi:hypothetical protein
MHSIFPFSLFLIAIFGFGGVALYARRSSVRLDDRSWETLLAAAQKVDITGISCIARDYIDPQRQQVSMEPQVIWELMGGSLGLRRMRANADLLLSLAAHAEQWNMEEGVIVTERMRRDALRLRSALRRIQIGMLSQLVTGRHWVSVPFQLQEAASAYYLMRQRLLALYETSHVALISQLVQAI